MIRVELSAAAAPAADLDIAGHPGRAPDDRRHLPGRHQDRAAAGRPGDPALLTQVLGNGTLLAAAALAVDLIPLLPLCVLVVAGDSIAGEANSGTLRYLLTRPVSRSRLLTAKLISILIFVLVAVVTVAVYRLHRRRHPLPELGVDHARSPAASR